MVGEDLIEEDRSKAVGGCLLEEGLRGRSSTSLDNCSTSEVSCCPGVIMALKMGQTEL